MWLKATVEVRRNSIVRLGDSLRDLWTIDISQTVDRHVAGISTPVRDVASCRNEIVNRRCPQRPHSRYIREADQLEEQCINVVAFRCIQ